MCGVLLCAFYLEAVRASPVGTNAALPGSRQETLTVGGRAAADELAGLLLFICRGPVAETGRANTERAALFVECCEARFHLSAELGLAPIGLRDLLLDIAGVHLVLRGDHVLWQIALFAIDENILTVFGVGLVEKRLCTECVEKRPIPRSPTVRTMGILEDGHDVFLDAFGTGLLVALGALDGLANGCRVGIEANGTGLLDGLLFSCLLGGCHF